MKILLFILLLTPITLFAQGDPFAGQQDDLKIGGDIFSDFNDNVEANDQMEDERYYRYGRFFSFSLGIGVNQFDGNRGAAYIQDPPVINFGLNYFKDFKTSFGIGFDIARNHFVLDYVPKVTPNQGGAIGTINVNHLTAYFSYRYYFETANLGTAVTYANPYFTFRVEYWYQTINFQDINEPDQVGGGLGFALGGGFEFPLKIKESYLGVEGLIHAVNLPDKFSNKWSNNDPNAVNKGIQDFTGNAYSVMISYVMSW